MIHQTIVSAKDKRGGQVYLRFGTADELKTSDGTPALALGVELSSEIALQTIRATLIMSSAEAIRLSDELRRLASETQNKARRF